MEATHMTNAKDTSAKNKRENSMHKGGKPKKKGMIVGAAALITAVAVVSVFLIVRPANAASTHALSDVTTLAYTDLVSAISATGVVESASSVNVYSTLNYKVDAVYVEVGDIVNKGDLLCELNTKDLEDQIKSRETSIGVSAASAQQQVKTARDTYTAAKTALDEGKNSSVISSENSATTAYNNWQKAQKTYDDYVAQLERGENSGVMSQEISVSTSQSSLDSARSALTQAEAELSEASYALNNHSSPAKDQTAIDNAYDGVQKAQKAVSDAQANYAGALTAYEQAASDYQADPTNQSLAAAVAARSAQVDSANLSLANAKSDLAAKEQAYSTASKGTGGSGADLSTLSSAYDVKQSAYDAKLQAYDNAKESLNNADKQLTASKNNAETTLKEYKDNIETTHQAYLSAQKSLEAAKVSAQTSLQANKNSMDTALVNANNDSALLDLAQLKDDLDAAAIAAPTSGTVTAVYATVGASGSGLLFVIEDVNRLTVSTTIKEYDVGAVEPGMRVLIRSDATGSAQYEGAIKSVAPTSQKDGSGNTITGGDILFPTDIAVESEDTGLRIGMSVRLSIVTQERENVLAVPYDAVYVRDDGQTCLIVLDQQEDGSLLLREVPVQTGIETDLSIEVSGEGIGESTRVIGIAANYRALIGQQLLFSDGASGGAGAATGAGGGLLGGMMR